MVLGISEDFTVDIDFDSELTNIPSSGLYINSGVHPSITNENLLEFLPKTVINFSQWSAETDYGVFTETRNKKDIVKHTGKIYQSIKVGINQSPSTEGSLYWLETNMNSLRMKNFIEKVKDKVYTDLSLNKRLINNQYLYDNGDIAKTLLNDYAGWVIEPKGSDYVSFRINQISIQKGGTTPINLYVINQNTLVKTITIAPNNGELNFVDTDIVLSGKGVFKLVIDSTDVFVGNKTIDSRRFDGFVAYTANGTGSAPETSKYTYSTYGNGIGLNITTYLDSKVYIENNLSNFGSFVRASFEYMAFQLFMHNSNNASNRATRIQMADNILMVELKETKADTVVARYLNEKRMAIKMLEKTFDTQLKGQGGLTVEIGSL
tara:strand:- start:941 stop:2071 length:1131 start_codon:yes stop_codon:yes gene_type:complete